MQCDYGSVYLPCGHPCPEACPGVQSNRTEFCESMTCSEGCFCPEGYVRSSKFYIGHNFYLTQIVLNILVIYYGCFKKFSS